MNNKRLSATEFIGRARKIHGKKYDYSKAKYINAHTKVTIICPIHGQFEQTPKHHVNDGYGCKLCGYEKMKSKQRLSQDEFIKRANKKHNSFYDYSKTLYKNGRTKVIVNCPIHGEFKILAEQHIDKKRPGLCPKCAQLSTAKKQSFDTDYFINESKKIHGEFYDYSKTKYKRIYGKVIIICPIHGEFKQIARLHMRGNGCLKCGIIKVSDKKRNDTKGFIEKAKEIHGNIYDYSKSRYGKNNEQKIIITCDKHGDFKQTPVKHLSGSGCPKCQKKHEGRIAEYLMKSNIVYREFSLENKRYDFYLPDFNILIERDGQQHYRNSQIQGAKINIQDQQKNDKLKTKIAKKSGYKIARLPYWLTHKEEKIEIQNILAGKPTYPDVPDLKQAKTKPKPKCQ